MKLGSKLVTALFLSVLATQFAAAQTVKTAQGQLSGEKLANSVVAFKGVPFAAPPVGDLRWREPQPAAAWQGVRKATEFGASCMQIKTGERPPYTKEFLVQNDISEDCLFLNLWTPQVKAGANLPVIVFFHGGGYMEGSGAIDAYLGGNLSAKGAVVVTVNYRLGIFGFLAHPELSAESSHHVSGNYGILDQIAALKWLNANVAEFGGNPHNITIWGQSAGAGSVAALVASPLAKGTFQRGQADSGLGVTGFPATNLKDAEADGVKAMQEAHASSIKEMRAMPASALMPPPESATSGTPLLRYAPIVDGWVQPDSPINENIKGTDNDVPVITGFNTGDTMIMVQPVNTVEEYHQMAQKRFGDMAGDFEKLYPVKTDADVKSAVRNSGFDRIRVSGFLWASARAKSHHTPVRIYFFDRAMPWPEHPEFDAFHTGEIPYFFLNLKSLNRPWEPVDQKVANEVSSYLLNFAKNSDPNGAGLPPWPKVDPSKHQTMELGAHTGAIPLADPAKVAFWLRFYDSPISKTGMPF